MRGWRRGSNLEDRISSYYEYPRRSPRRSCSHGNPLTATAIRRKQDVGDYTMDDDPKSLGALLFELPAVKAAKKVNIMSRVHRRLIEPLETEDNDLRQAI